MALTLFAGLPVRDFEAARPWYERLFGEVSFLPHATEAVWMLADERAVYVVEDADRAGHGLVTIFVDDEQLVELARFVKCDELIGATYVTATDDDLRKGVRAEPRSQVGACTCDVATNFDLVEVDASAPEPAPRSKAVRTPPQRVDRGRRHV
jgi:hypothetical protein